MSWYWLFVKPWLNASVKWFNFAPLRDDDELCGVVVPPVCGASNPLLLPVLVTLLLLVVLWLLPETGVDLIGMLCALILISSCEVPP